MKKSHSILTEIFRLALHMVSFCKRNINETIIFNILYFDKAVLRGRNFLISYRNTEYRYYFKKLSLVIGNTNKLSWSISLWKVDISSLYSDITRVEFMTNRFVNIRVLKLNLISGLYCIKERQWHASYLIKCLLEANNVL